MCIIRCVMVRSCPAAVSLRVCRYAARAPAGCYAAQRVAFCYQGRASATEGVLALSVRTVAVRECLPCAVCQKRSLMPIKAY